METVVSAVRYESWALERVLGRLRSVPAVDLRAVQILGHIVASQRLWLARILGEDTAGLEVWPDWDLERCSLVLEGVRESWEAFAAALGPDGLERPIAYRNTRGEEHETPLREILRHLARHGAYHRGQITIYLKRGGDRPVDTDYISWVRQVSGRPVA